MSFTRRRFLQAVGRNGSEALLGAIVAARCLEAMEAEIGPAFAAAIPAPPEPEEIRISSNENPLGPGAKVMQAITNEFDQVDRYPFNSRIADSDLMKKLGKHFGVKPQNIVLGAGSSEILRNAVRAFTSPERHVVTGSPSYESPVRTAKLIGTPVQALPVDKELRLDLDAMFGASKDAGLIFLCNPNNPTSTVHSAEAVTDFVKWVRRASPETVILIDEAYHDYVTDPSYRTSVPLALEYPNVFVTRTFSAAHGMAGLRVGYAVGRKDTIKALTRFRLSFNVNVLAVAGAAASIGDMERIEKERVRNAEVRKFTREFFTEAGYESMESQTNFIFVNIRRPAKEFREACTKYNVKVGRDFPPMEKTHVRISMGTMEEMHRAKEVFIRVLGVTTKDSPDRRCDRNQALPVDD